MPYYGDYEKYPQDRETSDDFSVVEPQNLRALQKERLIFPNSNMKIYGSPSKLELNFMEHQENHRTWEDIHTMISISILIFNDLREEAAEMQSRKPTKKARLE